MTSDGRFLIKIPAAAGDREEKRGTLTLPFDSARSRRDIVVTIRTLSFVCASEAFYSTRIDEKEEVEEK